MAYAPVSTEDEKTETPSVAQPPADGIAMVAPVNPLPVAAAPVLASNANSLASESAQTAAAPPAGAAQPAAGPGGLMTSGTATVGGFDREAARPTTAVAPAPKTDAQKALSASDSAGAVKPGTKAATASSAAKPPQSAADQQAEAVKGSTDNIKKMIEGDDPIARQEFNNLINGIGPKNQLAMEAFAMKLRQSGQDGPGAGDALMAMMGRDLQFGTDQMVGKIYSSSAERIYDLNKWGFSKATELEAVRKANLSTDFSTAVKAGQWDAAGAVWSQMYPGIPFNPGAAKSSDPATLNAFNAGQDLVKQLISQGDPVKAKEALIRNARLHPELYGFKTAEEAEAALKDVDFSKETWAINQASMAKQNESIRVAALQGDRTSAMLAIDAWFASQLPGTQDRMGSDRLANMSLDEINAVLKANGKAPLTSKSETSSISPSEFAKDVKYAEAKKAASGANATDTILNQIIDINPRVGTDPKLREASRAWIFANVANLQVNPDGSLNGFTFKDNAGAPPWDPKSVDSHFYTDWPMAEFRPDGTVEVFYKGGNAYSDQNVRGDISSRTGAAEAKISANWEQYVMDTRSDPSKRLTREQWYYATKGGTTVQPVAKPGEASPVTLPTSEDIAQIQARANTGAKLTEPEMDKLRAAGIIKLEGIDTLAGTVNSSLSYRQWLDSRYGDNNVTIGGKTVQLLGAGTDKNRGVLYQVRVGSGTEYLYDPRTGQFLDLNNGLAPISPSKVI